MANAMVYLVDMNDAEYQLGSGLIELTKMVSKHSKHTKSIKVHGSLKLSIEGIVQLLELIDLDVDTKGLRFEDSRFEVTVEEVYFDTINLFGRDASTINPCKVSFTAKDLQIKSKRDRYVG